MTSASMDIDDNITGLDGDTSNTDTIVVIATGNIKYEIDRRSLRKQCTFAENALKLDPDCKELDMSRGSADAIGRILEYIKYHDHTPPRVIPKPIPSDKMSDFVDEWDDKFSAVEHKILFDIMLTASYYGVSTLYNLMCAKLASILKNKTTEEVQKEFDITPPTREQDIEMKLQCGIGSTCPLWPYYKDPRVPRTVEGAPVGLQAPASASASAPASASASAEDDDDS